MTDCTVTLEHLERLERLNKDLTTEPQLKRPDGQEDSMTTWLKDKHGNEASVECFGSRERAQAALDSLEGCTGCTDCSGCLDCSDCHGCRRCSGCSGCFECDGCSGKKDETGDFPPPAIPKIENIHARVFAAASVLDALNMGEWHTCSTTHCRAGWVVHLAGDAGYALAEFHNTALAAQLIYRESGYRISPDRFYDNDEDAMADMKALAEAHDGKPPATEEA